MEEKILKRLSLIYVKILLQEKRLKFYIENEVKYCNDKVITGNRLSCYRNDVVKFKEVLSNLKVLQND